MMNSSVFSLSVLNPFSTYGSKAVLFSFCTDNGIVLHPFFSGRLDYVVKQCRPYPQSPASRNLRCLVGDVPVFLDGFVHGSCPGIPYMVKQGIWACDILSWRLASWMYGYRMKKDA